MAGGSRPKRALTASATCPAGTIGAAGAAAGGGAAGGGGGGWITAPGAARLAPGGAIGVGLAGAGTLGMRPGGIGAVSPGNRPPVDCAITAPGVVSAKMQANAAERPAPRPKIPDPTAIVAILSN